MAMRRKRIVLLLAAVAGMALAAAAAAVAVAVEKRALWPSVSCTKMMCEPEQPCCNSCYHDGWRTLPSPSLSARRPLVPLPLYDADGCGQVPVHLEAWGLPVGWTFYVLYSQEAP